MKFKLLNSFFFLIIVLVTTSCKKDLDETPFSTLSPSDVYTNEDGLKKATLGIYQSWTSMPSLDVFFRFVLAESGHKYATSGIFGAPYFEPYYRFGQTPSDGLAGTIWKRYFISIARANAVIDNANKAVSDTSIANIYIAEARFNRAYAYFNLVRDFGGVPLIKNEISSLAQKDAIYGKRSTVEETYSFIVEDLLFAEQKLPDYWTGVEAGRISAATAKAMLGKVYLTMAGKPLSKSEYYQKAVDKLKQITSDEAKYNVGLLSDFKEIFSTTNKRNKEVLLSYSYFYSSISPNASLYPFYLFPMGFLGDEEQTNFGLTYEFYKLFENGDTRRDYTVIDRYAFKGPYRQGVVPGDSIIYDPIRRNYIIQKTGGIFGNISVRCGLAYGKMDRVSRPAGSSGSGYSTDLIELRYADVLLCLAEALNESGNTADAFVLVNRVRARANAIPYTNLPNIADARSAIRKERRLELTGEFTTVYDIRRWGTLQAEITSMDPSQIIDSELNAYMPKLELFPIPQVQIDANPNLTQNPGY